MGLFDKFRENVNDFGENTVIGRKLNNGLGALLDAHDKALDNKAWQKFEKTEWPRTHRFFSKDTDLHKYDEIITVMRQADLLGRVEQPAQDLQSALEKINVPENKCGSFDIEPAFLEKKEIIALQNGKAILDEVALNAKSFLEGSFEEKHANRKDHESVMKEHAQNLIRDRKVEIDSDLLTGFEASPDDAKVGDIVEHIREIAGEVSHYGFKLDGGMPINYAEKVANKGLYNEKYKANDFDKGYMPYAGYGHPELDRLNASGVSAKQGMTVK